MDQFEVPAEAVITALKARIAEDAVTIAMLRAHVDALGQPAGQVTPG